MIIPKEQQRFKKKMRGCRKIQLLYLVLQMSRAEREIAADGQLP